MSELSAMTIVPPTRDLGERHPAPEALDGPHELEARQVLRALRGLARLDRFGGTARALWGPVEARARQLPTRSLRVLDLGGSGGTGAVRLWKLAARSGLKITVDGCASLGAGVELARREALAVGAPIHVHHLDPVRDTLPAGYDVITCSHLLHRLDDPFAVSLLRRMDRAAKELVLVHDLLRCSGGLRYARWSARWLQRSRVVREDACRSVRAGFTVEEVGGLATDAGLRGARVERRWPYRFLLAWRPRAVSHSPTCPQNSSMERCERMTKQG